ncbi:cyclin-like protein [Tilletiaria anomala UBC 951]|uniref:Cyclin-like protein n=1 Tax=Tilletiaria anomala (strain ATCC 24038 / CBS 436.72 / UBC 951) TaxID=1037660 RepID=A0A066VIZ0_TILAU|nr:cyclin-like protein [Tilletiaria anomala UBC 951]KDN40263.1 cyclin-like protein [Tilletiaria anomala UBC 951]
MAPLLNTLASLDQYLNTPSRADGIPADLEDELRMYGCQMIQQAGALIKLPQRAMATAQVLFQRFWFVTSMRAFSIRDVCTGALFLATKLEETPVRLRDLINVFDYLMRRALHYSKYNPGPRLAPRPHGKQRATEDDLPAQGSRAAAVPPFVYKPQAYHAQEFYDAKDAMVIAEIQILKRLGFNVQVNLPYATMINYLQLLGLTDTHRYPGVAQRAWSFLNDALQTPVYCLFPPHNIACAAVYLTAITAQPPISLPQEPAPWHALFDASEGELRAICAHILRLYDERPGEGLASRVREACGGMAEFMDKRQVRAWIQDNATAADRGEARGSEEKARPPAPWVLKSEPIRYDSDG